MCTNVYVLLLLVVFASAESLKSSESNPTPITSKIFGGKDEYYKYYPAYLHQNVTNRGNAFIISLHIVITAAQNVFGLEEPDYGGTQVLHSSYQFGETGRDFTKKIRKYNIRKIKAHPDCHPDQKPYYIADIALILLRDKIKTNNFDLTRLPSEQLTFERIRNDADAYVLGWGINYQKNERAPMFPMFDVVQRLDVKVISNEECKTRLQADWIQTSHICAVSSGNGYLLKGDAGAPLVLNLADKSKLEVIFGIASFLDGNSKSPHVYTRISEYRQFITDEMKNLEAIIGINEKACSSGKSNKVSSILPKLYKKLHLSD